jgi:hypothetical protein
LTIDHTKIRLRTNVHSPIIIIIIIGQVITDAIRHHQAHAPPVNPPIPTAIGALSLGMLVSAISTTTLLLFVIIWQLGRIDRRTPR